MAASPATDIISVNIEDELKQSYLDYAMSVIVGRALPDVRDGLKPVHRRVLFAMHELNNDWNKPYKKSARVVGDVIGKYHPHGDSAVYDAIVRLAQPFSIRYMLVDGQGNFGSIDGDAPAAMRYTEVRMAKITHSLLSDLEKETVDFVPNYDESEFAPVVLPTRIPNLLVNGASGIAVGMATNIPPHNLGEIIDGCLALIDNAQLSVDDLIKYIPGPDFPTAGIINGRAGIVQAYRTGRGRISVRAKAHIEDNEKSNKASIVVTELPYQVNKARLLEKIAELAKEKRIESISELRDESDKDGIRMVVELKRNENAEVTLNKLYNLTQMQNVYGINMVALLDGQPRTLNLKAMLQAFLQHRRDVVTRRSLYELKKSKEKAHLLEGLGIALTNIDEMIGIIKTSPNANTAKEKLTAKTWPAGLVSELLQDNEIPLDRTENMGLQSDGYHLTVTQAQAILDLKLHRLTGLEQDKIIDEYKGTLARIKDLLDILSSPERLMTIVRDELNEVKEEFSDPRRTVIAEAEADFTVEDLIDEKDVVVTLSYQGYAKYQPLDSYQSQRRGGKGKTALRMKDEDFVTKLLVSHTHHTLLCFSTTGKLYWLKVYQLPEASRIAKGRPIVNLLPLSDDEKINAILPIAEFKEDQYVVMATQQGVIKKVSLKDFSRPRSNGIIAIDLDDNDKLVDTAITDGQQDVMLFTRGGKVNRFNESHVRAMGRTARGVRGIKLAADDQVIDLIVANKEGAVLTVTAGGYGKRTVLDEYRTTSRGSQGVFAIQLSDKNGNAVVRATQVEPSDEIMLISDGGTLVRIKVDEVSLIGRNTQGVRLINLSDDEHLVGLQRIAAFNEEDEEA